MKDREFLLLVCLVTGTLIFSNLSLFLKSIASSSFLQPSLKQAAQQLKLEGFRQTEQAFWNRLKEVNLDEFSTPSEVASVEPVTIPPQPQPTPTPSPKPSAKPVVASPSVPPSKPEKPYTRFLLVGDSIMFDLGVKIRYSLNNQYQLKTVKLDYKVSTGLNRIDYYNWYTRTSTLIKSYQPDVIVVLFGGNDNQDIIDFQGKYRRVLSEEWKQAYRQRVERYAKLISDSSVRKVYWVGQPMSRKARYNKFFSILNSIYREVSLSHPKIEYVSTWETFSSKGKYTPVVADKAGKRGSVKASDGVHFTSHGAKIISELILEQMRNDKIIKPPASPVKNPQPKPKQNSTVNSQSPKKVNAKTN